MKGEILRDVSLKDYSWFRTGGNAEVLFKPRDTNDVVVFLKKNSLPVTVIGCGTNILVRDKGIRGAVVILNDKIGSGSAKLLGDTIVADCSLSTSKLYKFAKDNNIGGYEFLGTIPGTLGGAIKGNSGCYGTEIKDVLISVSALDFGGNLKTFTNEECNFGYRKNNLPDNLIFVECTLKADIKRNDGDIEKIYKEMLQKRISSQPQDARTCGSIFKNPPDKPAWQIIRDLGFQNKEMNGAKMSDKHANFMINTGNATSKNLEDLGELIKQEALNRFNVNLEWEIKILGEK